MDAQRTFVLISKEWVSLLAGSDFLLFLTLISTLNGIFSVLLRPSGLNPTYEQLSIQPTNQPLWLSRRSLHRHIANRPGVLVRE